MPLSKQVKIDVVKKIVGQGGQLGPSAWLGLSKTKPFASGASGTNITEPNSASYGRVIIGGYNQRQLFSTPSLNEDTGLIETYNNTEVYFPEATAETAFWTMKPEEDVTGADSLKYFVIFTTSDKTNTSEGSILAYGSLTNPVYVPSGNIVVMFRPGQLKLTLKEVE